MYVGKAYFHGEGEIKSMAKKQNIESITSRGLRIRALRIKKYISVLEIATYMDMSRTSFNRIENGERDLKCEEIIAIARYLNVAPTIIMGTQAPKLVSDKLKRFAVNSGFNAGEINPRLFDFVNTVVQDFHI